MFRCSRVALGIVALVVFVFGIGMARADVSFSLEDTIQTTDIPESMCTCNLDSDPMLEFVVVLGWSGKVVAYDHDGTELWTQTTGWYGAVGAGNIDADSQDEVAVNSADHHLYVYDSDGTVLCIFGLSELGHDRPRFGDLDGDGHQEIVFSEWDSNVYSATPANVYAFDPRGDSLLWTYQLPDDGVTHLGDIDGDGAAEVVASSRSEATTPSLVFLDGDGSVLWDTTAHAWRVGFWDVDDDDTLDVVFEWAPQGGVWCYDHNGQQLFSCTDKGCFTRLEDLDGNGEAEFLTKDGNTLRCIREDCSEAWSHTFSCGFTHPLPIDADGIDEKEVVVGLLTRDTVYVLSEGKVAWYDTPRGASSRFRLPEDYGDMSGDGLADIVLGNDAQWIYLYVNNSTSSPPTVIDNDVVHIEFDHDKGEIDALTHKYGSNQDILDQYWVSGLGRLHGLGEPGMSETGTIVSTYDVQSDHVYFAYENPLYGEKFFDISWSASDGVEIVITFEFSTADTLRNEEGKWEPGGNNDGNDYITVLKWDETEETFHYRYPGPWTLIWDGDAYGNIMWDNDYDERFGYRSECYMYTRVAEGASCDGPIHYMEQAGSYVLYFAVKDSAEFEEWFDSFENTGVACSGEEFRILSIQDVPNDQGRQIRVEWSRTQYDDTGEDSLVITEYSLWRKVDPDLKRSSSGGTNFSLNTPPGDWDFIATIPAVQDSTYNYVAPTLVDSTINEGMYYSVFFVRAHTANPIAHWETAPDGGYSLDNLSPSTPGGLAGQAADGVVELWWKPCPDQDFNHFAIYRDTISGFDPTDPLAYTMDTAYTDTTVKMGKAYYYRVSAFDFSGNQSQFSEEITLTGISERWIEITQRTFKLSQNCPNPFKPSTHIRYTVPAKDKVSIKVYNQTGQLVRVLVDEAKTAGIHEVKWDGKDDTGREIAGGSYFYRLTIGDRVLTKKMIMLK